MELVINYLAPLVFTREMTPQQYIFIFSPFRSDYSEQVLEKIQTWVAVIVAAWLVTK